MTKPESETDPWAKVKRRQGTVIEHGPGVLGGGAWSAKAAVYLAKEVDAARAAEAAQHRREVAALEHEAEQEHAVATAREGYVKTLEAERDRLKHENQWAGHHPWCAAWRLHRSGPGLVPVGAMRSERCDCGWDGSRIGPVDPDRVKKMQEMVIATAAERDRLKAALQDAVYTIAGWRTGSIGSIGNVHVGSFDVEHLARLRAALTPQGQSTDGETK